MGGISELYATQTPTPAVIPISDGSGKLNDWVDLFVNPMTDDQDLIVGGAGGAPGRLGVGNPGDLLTVGSGGIVAWEPPAVVPATRGGTGLTSYTVGDLLYADSTTTLAKLAAVAVGQVLVSAGVGTAPAWSATPSLTSVTLQAAGTTNAIITGAVATTYGGVSLNNSLNSTAMVGIAGGGGADTNLYLKSPSSVSFSVNNVIVGTTTSTGFNSVAIGATAASTGAFTTLSSTGATTLASAGSSVGVGGTATVNYLLHLRGSVTTAGPNRSIGLFANATTAVTSNLAESAQIYVKGTVGMGASLGLCYGIFIDNPATTGAGGIAQYSGLYVATQNPAGAGSTNYNIFSEAGVNYFTDGVTIGSTTLIKSTVNLANGAGALIGTLTNSPATGNPTKWVPVDDNGTTRYCPLW